MRRNVLLSAVLAAGLVLAGSAAAGAAPLGGTPVGVTTYSVVDHSITKNYTNYSQTIGTCKAKNVTQTCTISKGKSATRTIETSYTMTRGEVAAGLKISAASTVTTTVSCSATVKAGQIYKAWPVGSRHKYHVQKKVQIPTGPTQGTTTSKSGWKYAFNPYASDIECGL